MVTASSSQKLEIASRKTGASAQPVTGPNQQQENGICPSKTYSFAPTQSLAPPWTMQ